MRTGASHSARTTECLQWPGFPNRSRESASAACGSRRTRIATRSAPTRRSPPLPTQGSRFSTPHAPTATTSRLLAKALRLCGAAASSRIVTKGGMSRPGGAWVPDGRARSIRADCEASLEALDGLPIDLYLLHAPGSAHAVADLGSCAREAPRRRPGRPRRRLEREPRSARRGARARSDRGRPGRPQPLRRSGASRRRRRPLRGRRAHLHRALAARRAAPGESTRSQRVTRRHRRGTRRAGRGDRPRLDPRSRSERGRDPGRTPT